MRRCESKIETERAYFRCQKCGTVIDRDYNASLNLLSLITQNE
ncbi:zinc ribbon domain-containing protein [Bacteroides fragilis]